MFRLLLLSTTFAIYCHDPDHASHKGNIARLDYGNMSDQLRMEKLIENVESKELFLKKKGFVKKAEVIHSSGYQVLDRSALKSVKKWQFQPAEQFGVLVDSVLEIPFVFRLDDV